MKFHSHLTVFFFGLGDRVSEFDFWALLFLNVVDVLLLNISSSLKCIRVYTIA